MDLEVFLASKANSSKATKLLVLRLERKQFSQKLTIKFMCKPLLLNTTRKNAKGPFRDTII